MAINSTLEACTFSTASPDGGLCTRSISFVAHEHDAVARSIFLCDEPVWPGPDGLGDWAIWRRLSQPPWHDHRHHSARLRQGIQHEAKGLAQLQLEAPGIDRLSSALVAPINSPPKASRVPQRRRLAVQSSDVTALPSW